MAQLDPRIVRLGIGIGDNVTWYEDYHITAKGLKLSNAIASNCEFTIQGIDSESRNRILTYANPGLTVDRQLVKAFLEVGRESYGASRYYSGDVFRAYPLPKPDMGLRLKCLVGYNNKRKIVNRVGIGALTSLRQIAQWVAQDNGYKLSFQINDKQIRSYSFTGSAHNEISNLESLADSEVYVDNGTLYIKNVGQLAAGEIEYDVNNENGTLLEASATESGVSVRMMFHPAINVGSVINLTSELNPSINGRYTIYKVNFSITKRDTDFYLNLDGVPYA